MSEDYPTDLERIGNALYEILKELKEINKKCSVMGAKEQ